MNIYMYFLLFIFYSLIGWIIEIINEFITEKRYVNRGFLIGPYCPIYGCGAIFMIVLLTRYLGDPIVLFIMAIVICFILEYFTSYIMEKIFKARWWDYADRKYNINGRVCLETLVPFGIGGLIIMYLVNPFIMSIITKIPILTVKIISMILFVIFILDISISFNIIFKFRNITKKQERDNTAEITVKVKEILSKKSWFGKRLIKSFPGLKIMDKISKRNK